MKASLVSVAVFVALLVSGCDDVPEPVDFILVAACIGSNPDEKYVQGIASAYALTPFTPEEVTARKKEITDGNKIAQSGFVLPLQLDGWWLNDRRDLALVFSVNSIRRNDRTITIQACQITGRMSKQDAETALSSIFASGTIAVGSIAASSGRLFLQTSTSRNGATGIQILNPNHGEISYSSSAPTEPNDTLYSIRDRRLTPDDLKIINLNLETPVKILLYASRTEVSPIGD